MNDNMLRRALPLTLSLSFLLGTSALPAGASPSQNAPIITAWSFNKDAENWQYDGKWSYKGKPTVEYTKKIGDGALAARVDFRPVKDRDWSEVKLGQSRVTEEHPLDMGRSNRLSFDFYYQPQNRTTGTFKTKVYMKTKDGKEVQAIKDIDLKSVAADKNGFSKVHVVVPFDAPEKPVVMWQ